MIERLTEWLVSWPEDRVAGLLLQDAALCRAWRHSHHREPSLEEVCGKIEARLGYWLDHMRAPDLETEGRRHQWLLREVLGKLQQDRHHDLLPDEAAFLWSVQELLGANDSLPGHERLVRLLTPHLDVLRDICGTTPPSPGLKGLTKQIYYACEEDVRQAPQRETRLLAGIELPCRGPVLTTPCHLRLIGDVPDSCTVVVEGDGVCAVDGYVMGRVLSKTHCEVRGNISGAAVVLIEDIRARSIVNNGFVVAKLGNVYARGAQGAELIFAGGRLKIEGGTMLGHMIAGDIEVRDEVRGGRIETAGHATARRFANMGSNIAAVVLRESLSHEDFYEVTGAELSKLLSEANRLRRRIANFEAVADTAAREAEYAARSVLMYLFGGSETQRKLEVLVSMRDRLDLINRMVHNLTASLTEAEQRLTGKTYVPGNRGSDADFLAVDIEGTINRDLARQKEDVLHLQRSLNNTQSTRRDTAQLVKRVTNKLDELRKEHQQLSVQLAEKEKRFQLQGGYEKLLKGTEPDESKLQVLQKVLPTLRSQPLNTNIRSRVTSGFVTLALRNIERRMGYVQDYRERAEECREHFKAVSEQLGKDFHVTLPDESDEAHTPARVTGSFEAGVKIYLGMYVEDDNELPEDRIIETEEETERSFMLPVSGSGFHSVPPL